MFNDEFKFQYTSIPVAVFERNYKANTMKNNIESLSHHHRELEVLYVLEGEAVYYIDSLEYRIQKGDIVIVAPYLIHRATILASKDFSHKCLCFDLKLINDKKLRESLENGTFSVKPIISHTDRNSHELGNYVVNSFLAANEKYDGWELNVIGNLSLFFSRLKQSCMIAEKSEEKERESFCYRVISYIDNNYTQNISSSDAAKALFMNNSYFCRKFKDNFGYCFQKYIEAYRIEKAKILLKVTNLAVSEIALAVGFSDFSYFSKVFKMHQKCTPSNYRRDA